MAPKRKIIIDTDPGVDDVLAVLLALSASPDDIELIMLSVTYGNVPLQSCLRNVVALFNVLGKELAWRESVGRPSGYEAMKARKPIVAIGPEHPLEEETLAADYFHGADGLHNVHAGLPDLSPADTWESLFSRDSEQTTDPNSFSPFFTPSRTPSHLEILRLLKENPQDTISILAVGPLTNIALAASEDPETFLKVKELVVMGGAVNVEGNCSPMAEFNCFADAVAAARVYALTSPNPKYTMPTALAAPAKPASLPAYPEKLPRRLNLTLCPLDITTPHELPRSFFQETVKPYLEAGSPLAQWCSYFLNATFNQVSTMVGDDSEPALSLHDPLTVWYILSRDNPKWKLTPSPEDIRIETAGQWTRGMHVIDRRTRAKAGEASAELPQDPDGTVKVVTIDEIPGDTMGWLSVQKGNRINRVIESPGAEAFRELLMKQVFG